MRVNTKLIVWVIDVNCILTSLNVLTLVCQSKCKKYVYVCNMSFVCTSNTFVDFKRKIEDINIVKYVFK